MEKKYSMAILIGVVVLGGLIAVTMLLKKNSYVADEQNYVWRAEYDSQGAATLIRGKRIQDISAEMNKLVSTLNRSVEKSELSRANGDWDLSELPRITLRKTGPPTVTVEILNDKYLSEAMGSSGAQDYLAMATYTLTESPGIRSVEFVFEPGEHAMPGVYSRESFSGYTIVTKEKD
ncbi:MAG: hypothetical protein A2X58_08650 [Nitrospirae bacterium GWC2_56_14]|nr:MAG: hypothetical protein A2X58_08650 [Nitrospirae bacterium GWC2_56_14]